MREKRSVQDEIFDAQYQGLLFAVNPKNRLVAELGAISQLLDALPESLDWARDDLGAQAQAQGGRPPVATVEQVLRSALLMQLRALHYRQLAEEIDANPLYREFTRFYGRPIPHFSILNKLVKRISPETLRRIHEAGLRLARAKKIEDGAAIRHDASVAETDIAHPLDANLLEDSVRVLTRHLRRLREAAPELPFAFHDRTRAAKKRAYAIVMAKGAKVEERRRKQYELLLDTQAETRRYAAGALAALQANPAAAARVEVMAEAEALAHYLPLADRAHDQARRRVLHGEKVPASEKIVSLFEPHTNIICRGKQGGQTEFGHKFAVATGRSGLITWYEVLEGNPGDNEVLPRALEHHQRLFGRAPKRLTADRRYHSAENERVAAEAGIQQIALPKPGPLSEVRRALQRAPWFRRLLRWRAGIEGNLSTLLRSFGLKRCLWEGWESFQAYVGWGILAYNLRLMAGHLLHA